MFSLYLIVISIVGGNLLLYSIQINLGFNAVRDLIQKISNESILSEKIQKGKRIMILIDDVLKSGETIIYGIKQLLNYNVKKIETAILINRNHNNFPVGVNYVGLELSTTLEEHIQVVLNDKNEGAYLN